jgi:hypothetical protein
MALLLLLAAFLAAAGYGHAVASVLRLRFGDRLEATTTTSALGTGLMSTAVLALAAAGWLHQGALAALLGLGGAAGLWSAARRLAQTPRAPRQAPRVLARVLSGILALCSAANLFGALAPPTSIDALSYHLLAPRLYLEAGAMLEIPWDWHTYQPLAVEMLYALGLSLHGPAFAALLHAALGLAAAAGAALLGRRLGGPSAGLLAAATFYCTAVVAWESTSCYVELGVAAFGVLSLHAVLCWRDGRGPGWLAAGALLAGLAASCKLTGAIFPILGALVIVHGAGSRRRLGQSARALAVFGALALLPVLPWYGRSWGWTGNPVYPFLEGVFGENPDASAAWEVLKSYGSGGEILDFFLAPWRLVTAGAAFDRGEYLGALPVLLGPVVLWRARQWGERQALVLASLMYFGFWFAGSQQARFLVPILPVAAALVAEAAVALWRGRALHRLAVAAAVFPAIAVGAAGTLAYDAQLARVVLGLESEGAYLSRKAWYYDVFQAVAAEVPAHGRILVSQRGTFYLSSFHEGARPTDFERGREHLAALLERGRFTHLLVAGGPQEAAVAALGPRVALRWRRAIELPASRSLGGRIAAEVVLFEVRQPPAADSTTTRPTPER